MFKLFSIPFILVEASSISSLHGVMTSSVAANRLLGPNLTPSLSNYYREDLIAHVVNWPAEIAEKQVNRFGSCSKKVLQR